MSTPGDRIREMRIRNNLTLDDVAKKLNVNRQAVYKYEHGVVTNIPLENLEIMAEMFGTTPGYLAGWSDSPYPPLADPDEIAAKLRQPPPGVVVPDNALFVKAMNVMSPEDLATLNTIFARAFAKMDNEETK